MCATCSFLEPPLPRGTCEVLLDPRNVVKHRHEPMTLSAVWALTARTNVDLEREAALERGGEGLTLRNLYKLYCQEVAYGIKGGSIEYDDDHPHLAYILRREPDPDKNCEYFLYFTVYDGVVHHIFLSL